MDEEHQYRIKTELRIEKTMKLINNNKHIEAVIYSLDDPPYLSKEIETKNMNYYCVIKALNACNKSEMKLIIEQLIPEYEDTLAKYLYRALSIPQNNVLYLEWFSLLVDKSGNGSLLRALTDRKTV